MAIQDPYSDPDAQETSTLEAMATRLEERGQHPRFLRMIDQYARTLPAGQPLQVLDLGTGTGVVIRQLAHILHPDSILHGADISQHLLDEAAKLDPGKRISWDSLQPGSLPYGNATFDAVTMHTLLSHVPSPEELLAEAARILRPGGKLIVFDADHAGTTYGLPDYATMRRTDHKLTSAIATNPDICRQLPRILKAAGFQLTSHSSEIISECGHGDFWLSSVRGFAKIIPSLGILTPEEENQWVTHMLDSHEQGTFFAAGAFYTFHAEIEQ